MFIVVRNNILATQDENAIANCEILWIKLTISGSALFVGLLYRPPESNAIPLTELQASMDASFLSQIMCQI